jgi:hypothetical protein
MNLKNDAPRYRTAYQGFPRRLRDANPGDRLVIEAATSMSPQARCTRRSMKSGSW